MTKTKQAIHIDNIYWERVQLYIEGHSEGVDLTSGQFVLRNLTETKTLEANEMKIDGNTFICRFNVAILDDGYYLPMDKYLFVYHDQLEYIGQLNPNIIDQAYAALNEEQIEEYNELTTQNGKVNYLLAYDAKVFRKGGVSQHTVYTITPEIASDVNEFVFDISPYLKRNQGSLRQAHTGFINKDIKLHLKVEVSYLKLFLILQSYYILKEAKQYYSHQIRVRIYQGISSMYMMSYFAKK